MPEMKKRYIRLDECDVLSECVVGTQQMRALNREFTEHSQDSLMIQCPLAKTRNTVAATSEYPPSRNVGFRSEFIEQSQNSWKNMVQEKINLLQSGVRCGGVHSEHRELSQHSQDTMNVGRSRVQAASHVDP